MITGRTEQIMIHPHSVFLTPPLKNTLIHFNICGLFTVFFSLEYHCLNNEYKIYTSHRQKKNKDNNNWRQK